MAWKVDAKAMWVFQNPLTCAILIVGVGLLGGVLSQNAWGNSLFERFGALTAGFGVFVFGIVASELLARGQYTFILDKHGEPADPFKASTVRFALGCQAFVVFIGTIQWGFGSLLFQRECAQC